MILGVLALVYQGFTMLMPTNVVDLGVFNVAILEDRYIPLPPIVGIALLIAGIAMLMSVPAERVVRD